MAVEETAEQLDVRIPDEPAGYQVGDEVMVPARVTRVGKLGAVEAVTVELRIGQKVTANPNYLFDEPDDA